MPMHVDMNAHTNQFEKILRNHFRLSDFRKGQLEIISTVLNKQDVLAVLPTGGGKSLCYQFAAVSTQKLVIVVSPLIALMRDQVASLKNLGIPAGCLHSGQSDADKRQIFSDMQKGGAFVLYLSPERVQKEGFQKWIQDRAIALFAIDEAHCVSQWGHDFREEYASLHVLKTLRPDVPVLALTASATPTVLADIAKVLRLQNPKRCVHGFYRPNLYYQVETCLDDGQKLQFLIRAIQQTPKGRILIYCGTRKSTQELSEFLQKQFTQVGCYHAGLTSSVRTETQESYMQNRLRILVATNAFGMGMDQSDVRLVVHYQMPANIDSLYQEMGRAGRDGDPSTCLMLYAKKDKGLQSYFIQNSTANAQTKKLRWSNLDALVQYSEGGECRHGEILTYYKDAQRIERCGHCDSCDPKSERKIVLPKESFLRPKREAQSLAKSRKPKDGFVETPMDTEQEQRFSALKKWRKQKAQELDLPAFVVFSDKTLRQLALKNPQNMDELKTIYGIGESKLEKFGWDLLAELKS